MPDEIAEAVFTYTKAQPIYVYICIQNTYVWPPTAVQ